MEVKVVLAALALAALVEGVVEYYFALWIDILEGALRKRFAALAEKDIGLNKYVALGIAMALVFTYQVDLFFVLLGIQPSLWWVGYVLSGTLVGRGANYLHDFVSTYLVRPKE